MGASGEVGQVERACMKVNARRFLAWHLCKEMNDRGSSHDNK